MIYTGPLSALESQSCLLLGPPPPPPSPWLARGAGKKSPSRGANPAENGGIFKLSRQHGVGVAGAGKLLLLNEMKTIQRARYAISIVCSWRQCRCCRYTWLPTFKFVRLAESSCSLLLLLLPLARGSAASFHDHFLSGWLRGGAEGGGISIGPWSQAEEASDKTFRVSSTSAHNDVMMGESFHFAPALRAKPQVSQRTSARFKLLFVTSPGTICNGEAQGSGLPRAREAPLEEDDQWFNGWADVTSSSWTELD